MGLSDRLQLSDIRSAFRILGDVRDLRHDQVAQDRLIVDGLCELLGAQLGWGVSFDGFRPGLDTRIKRFVPGTVQDPLWMSYLERWGKIGNFDDDPMTTRTRPRLRPVEAVRRSALFSMNDWSAYSIYDNFIDPAGVKDTLVLWFRYPGSDRIRGYSLQRTETEKEFDRGQVRLARLFAQELSLLHAQGKLEPAGAFDHLPKRLRCLVPLMLTGLSQKQIASQLNLSYHTLRSYTKELYDILNVHSREELTASLQQGALKDARKPKPGR